MSGKKEAGIPGTYQEGKKWKFKVVEHAKRKIEEVLRSTQETIGIFEYLSQAYANGKEPSPKMVMKDYEEYVAAKNGKWNLRAFKRKIIDSVGGKGEQTYSLMLEEVNVKSKGAWESAIPNYLQKLLGMGWKSIPDNQVQAQGMLAKLHETEAIKTTKMIGSVPLEDEIMDQLCKTLIGKKPRKYKPAPKTGNKTFTPPKMNNTAKAAIRKQHAIARQAVDKLKQVKSKSAKTLSRNMPNTAEDQKEAFKLRAAINRKLPAEMRRNMGRPALMNRTGRFSNSVKLETLTATKAGYVGHYSYMLSPYETFENKGKQKWPVAYNPKPLITKSIRNLAMGFMEAKLTLRRI